MSPQRGKVSRLSSRAERGGHGVRRTANVRAVFSCAQGFAARNGGPATAGLIG